MQLEDKAQQEAEVGEQEEFQLLEEQRQREDEERLRQEFHRHQECHALKKKKKDRSNKDTYKADQLTLISVPTKEPNMEALPNGTFEQDTFCVPLPARQAHKIEASPLCGAVSELPNHANGRDSKQCTAKELKAKQQEQLSLLLDLVHHKENYVKHKQPKSQVVKLSPEQVKKSDTPKLPEVSPKPKTQNDTKARASEVAPVVEQRKEEKKGSNGNHKKQLNHLKEEKPVAVSESTVIGEQQNSKTQNTAESPQPKGKSKRNKKKKGDKVNSSIGKKYSLYILGFPAFFFIFPAFNIFP